MFYGCNIKYFNKIEVTNEPDNNVTISRQVYKKLKLRPI